MYVLVACEESQIVCCAFRNKGHFAFSCDLQNCSGNFPQWHIKGDVLPLLNGYCEFYTQDGKLHFLNSKWDLIIAHPPCTYMSKAGARWMYNNGIVNFDRLDRALAAKEFFYKFYNANCDKIAIENPIPLKIVGLPPFTQKIQPYEFGHPFSKATCLWLKGLPLIFSTQLVYNYKPFLPSNTSNFSKGKGGCFGVAHNSKQRSKTFYGIAAAMAETWG